MGSSSVEILSLILTVSSFVSFILCSTTDCWRQDAKDPLSSVGLSSRCRGLWSECLFDNMAGIWTCDFLVSYLNEHPVALVVSRALVLIEGVLCFAAAPLLILGMGCTTVISNLDHHKQKFFTAAGIILLMAGFSGGTAVFWYAIDTATKYRTEVDLAVPGITYELGYTYWLAAASALCAVTSALLLMYLNCKAGKRSICTIEPGIHNNAITYL
ncbi:claudin-16-like [Xenopus laevis]|uniref:Claudin n=2 Tax=Xenopus laevis TaxID=8355 RepID=A0A974HCB8_XENLA|nr:claudin-16-like [Xenopus laevis]OCT72710.1 hypothetical protein XELAEV_18035693mg [Xenopus laevis]